LLLLPESTAQKGTLLSGYPPASKVLISKRLDRSKGCAHERGRIARAKTVPTYFGGGILKGADASHSRLAALLPDIWPTLFGINWMKKDSDPKESSYRAVAVAILIAALTAAIGYIVAFIDEHRKNELQLSAVLARRDRIEKSLTGFFIGNDDQKFDEDCS
jgi:hypothetical protein